MDFIFAERHYIKILKEKQLFCLVKRDSGSLQVKMHEKHELDLVRIELLLFKSVFLNDLNAEICRAT